MKFNHEPKRGNKKSLLSARNIQKIIIHIQWHSKLPTPKKKKKGLQEGAHDIPKKKGWNPYKLYNWFVLFMPKWRWFISCECTNVDITLTVFLRSKSSIMNYSPQDPNNTFPIDCAKEVNFTITYIRFSKMETSIVSIASSWKRRRGGKKKLPQYWVAQCRTRKTNAA